MMSRQRLPTESTRDNARGYALLLSVVITSAVLSTASALAGIILTEIRQTRQTSGAISAYAQAEQSAERALFILRQTDMSVSELQEILPEETTVALYDEAQHFHILENDFVSLPIPEGDAPFVPPAVIDWEIAECPNESWIEVTTVTWQDGEFKNRRQPYPLLRAGSGDREDINPIFPEGIPVEMRIRALYCDIEDLAVDHIPGRYQIVSRGQQGDVVQALETFIIRKPPAAGLFDFVFFSECEVIKGDTRNPSCPIN